MARIRAILFDLDGTLLDTLPDLAGAVNAALSALGLPRRGLGEIRGFVGNGIDKLIERALGEGASGFHSRAKALFRAHYAEHMTDGTAPYAGIADALRALRERGVGIGVVSNKYDSAARACCEHYFGGLIDAVVGEGGGVPPKPDPECAIRALRALGASPEDAALVGDSDVDLLTARAAGLRFVGVSWGFRGRAFLEAAGAAEIADDPAELAEFLSGNAP